jgi:hypothetical protein
VAGAQKKAACNMSKINSRPTQGNSPRKKFASSGLEAAMERDRRFFERHPYLSEYSREIMPGEYPLSEMPPDCEAHGRVTVRQIAPGFRVRLFAPGCFFFVVRQR